MDDSTDALPLEQSIFDAAWLTLNTNSVKNHEAIFSDLKSLLSEGRN